MSKQINKYVYVSYLVQAINLGVNFVSSLVIVHLLGASGFGEYSVFNNSLAFSLLLLGFNMPSVIVFFITNKQVDEGKLLFSSILLTVIVSVLLWLMLSHSDTLGFSIHIFPGGNNASRWIFFFVTLFLLLQLNQIFSAFLNAHKVFIPVSFAVLVLNLSLLLFWLLFTTEVFTLPASLFDSIWWVNIFLNIAVLLYLVYLVNRRIDGKVTLKIVGLADLKSCLQGNLYKMCPTII